MGLVKAIILIGGPQKGTRFRPLSFQVPKPLFPIAGYPMIQHHIEACSRLPDCKEIIILGYYQPTAELKKFIQFAQKEHGVLIRYLQEYCPLGTAGGLYHFRDQILRGNPSAFFVFNSDVHCHFPLEEMLKMHVEKTKGEGHIILGSGANAQQAVNYGCIVKSEDTLEVMHYVEKPNSFISNIINAGVYLFSPSIFDCIARAFDENYGGDEYLDGTLNAPDKVHLETSVLPKLAQSGKFFVCELSQDNKWCQVKNGGSAIYANRLYLSVYRRHYPTRLAESGEGQPQIIGDVQIHAGAQVDPTAVLGPNVYIGNGVIVGPGARVKESIILDRAELKDHCCILHSIIGWDCVVGQWARVEGYPSDLDPNDPLSLIASDSLFNEEGRLNPSITILGEGVAIPGEVVVLNSIVLPHKELSGSYKNQIIL